MTRTSEPKPSSINGEHYKAATAAILSNASVLTNGGTEAPTTTVNSSAAATAQPTSVSLDDAATATGTPVAAVEASTPVTRNTDESLARTTGYANISRRTLNNSNNSAIGGNGNSATTADNATSNATSDNCRKLPPLWIISIWLWCAI
uniref:Uncharacterized protein RC0142 n=1 Tax=Zeugodacus cucurbitae TaxID=28588 RepID=A0A0A1XDT6_ZEUCU